MIDLTPVLQDALQEQLTRERQNAAIYSAIGDALDNAVWDGGARWMRSQAVEEQEHAGKIRDYLIDRNVTPRFEMLDSAIGAADLPAAFAMAAKIEADTTTALLALHATAELEEDAQTCIFLQWFLAEQVEEERAVMDIQQLLSRADGNAAMLLIDKRLSER